MEAGRSAGIQALGQEPPSRSSANLGQRGRVPQGSSLPPSLSSIPSGKQPWHRETNTLSKWPSRVPDAGPGRPAPRLHLSSLAGPRGHAHAPLEQPSYNLGPPGSKPCTPGLSSTGLGFLQEIGRSAWGFRLHGGEKYKSQLPSFQGTAGPTSRALVGWDMAAPSWL